MLVLRLPARFPLATLLAAMLGALHAASFLQDATWPLEIVSLAALLVLVLRAANPLGAARVGFAFGLGWFLVGVSWTYVSLHTYGEMVAPLAAAGTLALCGYLSLYPALACALTLWILQRARSVRRVIPVFAGLWALGEYGRGWLFTGFPWLASGYAHVGGPLAGYAPLIGVYGVTLIAALVAASLAQLAQAPDYANAGQDRLVATLLLIGLPICGALLEHVRWSEPVGSPISVRLLQGNISQDIKFDAGHFDATLDAYGQLVELAAADLIVLPETALPRFFDDIPPHFIDRLRDDAQHLHAAIAFGVPIADSGQRYTNSVLAFDPAGGPIQRYDKSHLVPFGEFVPYGFRWFVDRVAIPLGDFTAGATTQKPMNLAGRRIAFNICYEDLFGEEIIRQAGDAGILVNVSNVAWFGDSLALPEHLQISRMRAIETARPMLRSTNTGMTAAIDPSGTVLGALPPFARGVLAVQVQAMTGQTPYVRFGNGLFLIITLSMIAIALMVRPTRSR